MNSALLTDGYKLSHPPQYPPGTTLVYSGLTPRSIKHAPKGCEEVVVFGPEMTMKKIHEHFEDNFFKRELRTIYADHPKRLAQLKAEVIDELKFEFGLYLGTEYDTSHFEKLWDLGYLPIEVKSLQEGTICPIKVPMLTIYNTHPEFYWVTNFLETIISNMLWKPTTSASIALAYRKILTKYALETNKESIDFVKFQGHDFSMRGLDAVEAAVSSGLGHLTSFYGSDSLPVLWGARKYYNEEGFVACSVPATEHSVMCAGSKEGELDTFKRLLKTYPKGILSVVSDTWDLWNVITVILPALKDQILARDGKLVIRPDSGDPVDIICGAPYDLFEEGINFFNTDPKYIDIMSKIPDGEHVDYNFGINVVRFTNKKAELHPKHKGVIELLWDIFGGTINEQGYKVLDPHIGAIYGDSITLDRAEQICERLKAKGFASTNIVLGIGSFTYQYNTRDTFGFAMKATYVEREEIINDTDAHCPGAAELITIGYPIFKDPITDDGTKKSATGLMQVIKNDAGKYELRDNVSWLEERDSELKTIYRNGEIMNETSLLVIRLLIDQMFE